MAAAASVVACLPSITEEVQLPMTAGTDTTLTGYFDSIAEARQCMVDLLTAGFREDQVRLVEDLPPIRRPSIEVMAANGTRARAEGILRRDHALIPRRRETQD